MTLDINHSLVRRTDQELAQPGPPRSAWDIAAWVMVVVCGVAAVTFTLLVLVSQEDDAASRTILTGQSARAIEGPIEAELGLVSRVPQGTSQRTLEGPSEAYVGWGAGPPKGTSARGIEGAIPATPSGPPNGISVRAMGGPDEAAHR